MLCFFALKNRSDLKIASIPGFNAFYYFEVKLSNFAGHFPVKTGFLLMSLIFLPEDPKLNCIKDLSMVFSDLIIKLMDIK